MCQYCRQRATHKHTPAGATYVMDLCDHHYYKCVDDLDADED